MLSRVEHDFFLQPPTLVQEVDKTRIFLLFTELRKDPKFTEMSVVL